MSTTIRIEPDVQQKLAILGSEASDEVTDARFTNSTQQDIMHLASPQVGQHRTLSSTVADP